MGRIGGWCGAAVLHATVPVSLRAPWVRRQVLVLDCVSQIWAKEGSI
jgi:hypothetical protein